MHNLKINIKSILEYIIAFCIVLECESIWKWQVDYGNKFKIVLFLILVISIFAILIIKSRSRQLLKIKKSFINVILIPIAVYLMFFIFININNIRNVIMFSTISILILLYQHCIISEGEKYRLLRKISNIVVIIAAISLIIFVSSSVIKIVTPNVSIVVERNGLHQIIKGYFNFYYESQKEVAFGIDMYRNTSIFYEAPKYSLILCIALFYEMFFRENCKKNNIIILIMTILTTFSMNGIILMTILVVIKLMMKLEGFFKSKILMVICLIILVFTIGRFINNMLEIKSSTTSYSDRIDDYVAGYKAWMENPLIGNGYGNNEVIKKYMSSFRKNNIGFSNSIFRVLAQGGVYLFSLYIIPCFICLFRGIKQRNKIQCLLSFLFIFLFITTSFPYNYIAIYLVSIMLLE